MKVPDLQARIQELKERRETALRKQGRALASGGNTKKKAKPVGYKMQNTFEKSVQGVPGGSFSRGAAIPHLKMVQAKHTGTRVMGKEDAARRLGLMRSMRNANTTQGGYYTQVLQDQTGDVISNRQGRDVR